MAKPGGVFCLEGQWDDDLAHRGSVLPTLELLERLGAIRFIHRDTATPAELKFFVDRWLTAKYAAYQVGFFAIDGSPGRLCLSKPYELDLAEVAELMAGRADGKRLYFGTGSVLRASDATLVELLRVSGASMLCGFTKRIDWLESAAFETVVLNRLANSDKVNGVELLARSPRWAPLAEHLGFRVVYRNGESRRVPAMRERAGA
ncbi:DUF6642 family protein [Micromonospora echinospora]|uniref:DUF6642 family protein n=1 Tax=Micromonospora echinospora TaxID=1877 RepID=UPI003672FE4F